jgi:hypothetical protein
VRTIAFVAKQRRSLSRPRTKAVVPITAGARLDLGDCDSAPGLLAGRFRASTITCCVGTGRTEGPLRPRSAERRLARRSGHLVPAVTRAARYRPERSRHQLATSSSPAAGSLAGRFADAGSLTRRCKAVLYSGPSGSRRPLRRPEAAAGRCSCAPAERCAFRARRAKSAAPASCARRRQGRFDRVVLSGLDWMESRCMCRARPLGLWLVPPAAGDQPTRMAGIKVQPPSVATSPLTTATTALPRGRAPPAAVPDDTG